MSPLLDGEGCRLAVLGGDSVGNCHSPIDWVVGASAPTSTSLAVALSATAATDTARALACRRRCVGHDDDSFQFPNENS